MDGLVFRAHDIGGVDLAPGRPADRRRHTAAVEGAKPRHRGGRRVFTAIGVEGLRGDAGIDGDGAVVVAHQSICEAHGLAARVEIVDRLTGIGAEGAQVDQVRDVVAPERRLRDHHAAVGVTDQDHLPGAVVEHRPERRRVVGQIAEGKIEGLRAAAALAQGRDAGLPAPGAVPGPVDQNDASIHGVGSSFSTSASSTRASSPGPNAKLPPGPRPVLRR